MPRRLPKLPRRGRGRYLFRRSATHLHRGIDLASAEGTPVYAPESGTITHASAQLGNGFSGYGGHVAMRTDGSPTRWLLFAHLSGVDVRPGQRVARGQLVGRVGRTCYTEEEPTKMCGGAHLHFEVSPTPYPQASEAPRVDPIAYLEQRQAHPMASAPATPHRPDLPTPQPAPSPATPAPAPAPRLAPRREPEDKGQPVRVADVTVIGPLMVVGGLGLASAHRGAGAILALLGVGTSLYNARNFAAHDRAGSRHMARGVQAAAAIRLGRRS